MADASEGETKQPRSDDPGASSANNLSGTSSTSSSTSTSLPDNDIGVPVGAENGRRRHRRAKGNGQGQGQSQGQGNPNNQRPRSRPIAHRYSPYTTPPPFKYPLARKLWIAFTVLLLFFALVITLITAPPQALLYLLALTPVAILLAIFYIVDHRQTLPIVVAFESLWFGALVSCPIALGLELLFLNVIWPMPTAATPGAPSLGAHIFYAFIRCVFFIALVEEACKLLVIARLRPGTPEHPYETDTDESPAVVAVTRRLRHPYSIVLAAVCSSGGFAAVENIAYVMFNDKLATGIQIAILRAIVSVPGHMAFSALAGTYVAMYKYQPQLVEKGIARTEPYSSSVMTFFGLGKEE